jgi:hypothetical protein
LCRQIVIAASVQMMKAILIAVILTMGGYAPVIFRRDGMAAA